MRRGALKQKAIAAPRILVGNSSGSQTGAQSADQRRANRSIGEQIDESKAGEGRIFGGKLGALALKSAGNPAA
jgi:hypothetical protein